jgi:hypothetical protein
VEEKDILQINATMIAGLFIFLSISIGILEGTSQEPRRLVSAFSIHAYVAVAIIPFTFSSLTVILAYVSRYMNRKKEAHLIPMSSHQKRGLPGVS